MSKGKPAFTTTLGLGVTYFSLTRPSNVCRSFKPIPPPTAKAWHTQHFKISANADGPSLAVEPILEGDLVAYRNRGSPVWSLGAVIETSKPEQYHVRSLYSRTPAEDGTVECFVDWEADSSAKTIASDTYEIKIVEVDYEERIVQDRLENPHGEVSEDCWRISTELLDSLGVIIREHDAV